MEKLSPKTEAILLERFCKESLISLSTSGVLFSDGTRYEIDFSD